MTSSRTWPRFGLLAVAAVATFGLVGCSAATPGADDESPATRGADDESSATQGADDQDELNAPLTYTCEDGSTWNTDACNHRLYMDLSTELVVVDTASHTFVDSLDLTSLGDPCALDLQNGYAYFLENTPGGHAISRYDLAGPEIVPGPTIAYDFVQDDYLGGSSCSVTDQRDLVVVKTPPQGDDGKYRHDPALYYVVDFSSGSVAKVDTPEDKFLYPEESGAAGHLLLMGDDGDGYDFAAYDLDLASLSLTEVLTWPTGLDELVSDPRTRTLYLANNYGDDSLAKIIVVPEDGEPFAVDLPTILARGDVHFAFFDPATALPVFEINNDDDESLPCAFLTLTGDGELAPLPVSEQLCGEAYVWWLPGTPYVMARRDHLLAILDIRTGSTVGEALGDRSLNLSFQGAYDGFNDEIYYWTDGGELVWHNFMNGDSGTVPGFRHDWE